ncbi:WRKY transcription factor [Quillaja saponaria]|uniref:WRKY transcription factor n=1 Tax=Quillaja saponaria TaxID=32244 RepID=A0AAD7LG49_QUISA|nr:WRKY transcription factor [Quillaja saponaria]
MESYPAVFFPSSSSTQAVVPPSSFSSSNSMSLNMANSHEFQAGNIVVNTSNIVFESKSFGGEESTSGDQVKVGKKKSEKKIKKPKYAFQTRSQVDILDDGYRWRKYGQKAVKNNKFPSYYRCTHQGCHVKKQVQRLTKDEGVVVTTYEGIHSHPIEKSTDNFEHILSQMQIYSSV